MNKFYFVLFLFVIFCGSISACPLTPQLVLQSDNERFDLAQNYVWSSIEFCGLEKGVQYDYWYLDQEGTFTASAYCTSIYLSTEQAFSEISIGKRSKHKSNNLNKTMANLGVDNSFIPQELITNVLIGGNCYGVSNIENIGSTEGIGYFFNGEESLGFGDGIILSTGSIFNAPGPNTVSSAGNNLPGIGNDNDLQQMATNTVNDATGIEFDFTPTTELIEFEYVFASEEYCEYVGSSYNDVFGFFISGPGINGTFQFNAENIAKIPNSNDNVAINSVNHQQNTEYFIGNNINCDSDPMHPDVIQYDGFTTTLTARAEVIPCETYHIRLVVGDVGDGVFDSAVFLKANSFQAAGGAVVEANSPFSGTNIAYEGCQNGEFIFSRDDDETLNEDLIIDFEISPAGNATPNVDYVDFPSIITIPAGQMSAVLPVEIIDDNLVEGEETIILEVPASCNCSQSNVTMFLQDVAPLQIEPANPEVCGSESVSLSAITQGGMGEYTYLWSNGMTTADINVPAIGSGTASYTVTVTDECGNENSETSTITAVPPPTASISGSGQLCPEDTQSLVGLQVNLTGEGPWEITYRYNNITQPTISTNENPYVLNVNGLGEYTLESVSYTAGYCPGTTSGSATIEEAELPTAFLSGSGAFCPPEVSAGLDLPVSLTGTGPWELTYSLNGTPQTPVTFSDLQDIITATEYGTYTLESVSYADGLCVGTVFGDATIDERVISISSEVTDAECADTNTGAISLTGDLGIAPYFFDWENHDFSGSNPTNLFAGNYNVTMTDAAGCQAETVLTVNQPPRLVAEAEKTEGLCEGDLGTISIINADGGTPDYLYSVDGGASFTSSSFFERIEGGEYDLVLQDAMGCEWVEKIEVFDPPALELWTEPEVEIEFGDSYDIFIETNIPAADIASALWTNTESLDCGDCLEPVATPFISTPFHLIVTTNKGCVEETSLSIRVNREKVPVFVPNVFSPDNDGINDRLNVFAKESAVTRVNSMSIYSRWGETVYVANDFLPNDLSIGWDGNFRDKPVDPGVFIWFAEVEYIDGTSEMLKGDVTVLR